MFTERRRVNVSAVERRVSLAAGGALAVYALRRSLDHLLLLGLGGYLVYRGTTGNCQVYQALGLSTAFDEEVPSAPKAPDSPPGGPLGLVAAGLLKGVTAQQVREDLRRFKEALEAGETASVDGQPSGRVERTAGEGGKRMTRGRGSQAKDEVQSASEQSFPASDPPGWEKIEP
jgi:uncharacterized membrane protein